MEKTLVFCKRLRNRIAFASYILACASLFLVQREYADTLLTANFIVIGALPVIAVVRSLAKKDVSGKESSSGDKAVSALFLVVILLLACWLLYLNIYYLAAYQLLALLTAALAVYVSEWKQRKGIDITYQYIVTYFALLISTILYLVILKPCTVSTAQKKLTDNGYVSVSLLAGLRDKSLAPTITGDNSLHFTKAECGMYHFICKINGEDYNVLVDVLSGKTISVSKPRP